MEKKGKYALTKVKDRDQLVVVPVTGEKPAVPEAIQNKWQEIVDLLAKLFGVPSGLVTMFTENKLNIFAASQTTGNPYKLGDSDSLGIGMFCESVAGLRKELYVDDTSKTEYWKTNPHAGFGMHCYLGVPIQWPDGEVFGTFCFLSDKTEAFKEEFAALIRMFRDIIETDLVNILSRNEMEEDLVRSRTYMREIHHRIKNQFSILISYLNLKSKTAESVDDIVADIEKRIAVISMIHEALYQDEETRTPGLDVYLEKIARYVIQDFDGSGISLSIDVESLKYPMNTQILFGLILVELLTNSLKHAFAGKKGNEIKVSCKRAGEGRIELVYEDNGRGFPSGFSFEHASSIGLILIKAMAAQMGGTVEAASENGVVFKFRLSPK